MISAVRLLLHRGYFPVSPRVEARHTIDLIDQLFAEEIGLDEKAIQSRGREVQISIEQREWRAGRHGRSDFPFRSLGKKPRIACHSESVKL